MAAMDFSLRRDDRGMSVFWMILIMGAGVFALLALVLVLTNSGGEAVEYGDEAEIIVNEGDTTVHGVGNTSAAANENDATFLGDTQTVDGPTPEGDLSVEGVEAEVAPGDPIGGTVVDPAEAGTDADAGMEQGSEEGIEAGGGGPDADQEDVVVDPDGTTAPVVPTPSGPEGNDDEALTVD
jgi:hypothetical protein